MEFFNCLQKTIGLFVWLFFLCIAVATNEIDDVVKVKDVFIRDLN
jgi:hypothetical protein